MDGWNIFRHVLLLAMFIVFIFQLAKSIDKLENGVPATKISTQSQETLVPPNFAIALFQDGNLSTGNLTLPVQYEKIRFENLPFINLAYVSNDTWSDDLRRGQNVTNWYSKDEVEALGLSFDQVWQHQYMFVLFDTIRQAWRLDIFQPPSRIPPSLFNGIDFRFPCTSNEISALIKVYNGNDLTNPMDYLLGGAIVRLVRSDFKPSNPRIRVYEIEEVWTKNINTNEHKCNENDDTDMRECILSAMDQRMGCVLPWRAQKANYSRPCDTHEDVQKFYEASLAFYNMGSLKKITEVTGCTQNCRQKEYRIRRVEDNEPFTPEPDGFLRIRFQITQSTITERVVYASYDLNSFIGDVGGFLGLLLGFSIPDLYDLLQRFIKKYSLVIR